MKHPRLVAGALAAALGAATFTPALANEAAARAEALARWQAEQSQAGANTAGKSDGATLSATAQAAVARVAGGQR